MRDFAEATDRLIECVTLEEIADAMGVSRHIVKQARLDPASPSYRVPPTDWHATVARLARERGNALLQLAKDLERE